jgi:hypothetical protein
LGTHRLSSFLGEVIGRDEASSHAFVKTRPTVVGSVYDRVLETTRILEVQVQLAVLGAVCGSGARADIGLELIEAVSNDLCVM